MYKHGIASKENASMMGLQGWFALLVLCGVYIASMGWSVVSVACVYTSC